MEREYELIVKKKNEFFKAKISQLNFSTLEGLIIFFVGKYPMSNQDTLAMMSGIDKYRVAKVLSTLEDKEMVSRASNPSNKREKNVMLTEKGKEIFKLYHSWTEEWEKKCFTDFEKDEIDSFIRCIEKIKKNIE